MPEKKSRFKLEVVTDMSFLSVLNSKKIILCLSMKYNSKFYKYRDDSKKWQSVWETASVGHKIGLACRLQWHRQRRWKHDRKLYVKICDKAFKNVRLKRAALLTYFQVLTTAGTLPLRRDRDGQRVRRCLSACHLHYGSNSRLFRSDLGECFNFFSRKLWRK